MGPSNGTKFMTNTADQARMPRHLLRDLYMVRVAKRALERGVCPDCGQALEVIDTWERACPTPGCGYTFNYYQWPWMTAPLGPDGS